MKSNSITFLAIAISFILTLLLGCSSFGQNPKGDHLEKVRLSENYNIKEDIFLNQQKDIYKKHSESFSFIKILWKALINKKETTPNHSLPTIQTNFEELKSKSNYLNFIWYGHSTFLVNTDKKNILFDPVFSMYAAPYSFMIKRFQKPAVTLEQLPNIDYVVISHDHYDHLDQNTIKFFKEKKTLFIVPMGVGSHLSYWGIPDDRIIELEWWKSHRVGDLDFICTPSQHFSGRSFNNRNKTLWASWVLKTKSHSLFFSGDTGYNKHFKEIGNKYGPFDVSFLENGQYDEDWPLMHMHPKETTLAAKDLKTKWTVPVHWGAFSLSRHSWYDPPKDIDRESEKLGVKIIYPIMGQIMSIGENVTQTYKWWKKDL